MNDQLLWVALAGFLASMVDGALGMGFGPTSSSILLGAGLSPAAASSSVNLVKVATGLLSGFSHHRFGNVDRRLTLRLALPGAAGAVIGVTVLANVDGALLRPWLAGLLLLVGLRIMWRFSTETHGTGPDGEQVVDPDGPGIGAAAAVGGVTNGVIGAWGPVVTPYLLHRGVPPRYSVGCVNTAEIAVAAVSSAGLVASFGSGGLRLDVIAAMLAGGIVGSPLAAYVLRWFRPRVLGVLVGTLLLATQTRELVTAADLGAVRWYAYALVLLVASGASLRPRVSTRTTARRGDKD